VRLRKGEKEKEWKRGSGAEEEGKGERCLRPHLKTLLEVYDLTQPGGGGRF